MSGIDRVLGWMSMDNPRTSIGPVDWMGEWDRECIGLMSMDNPRTSSGLDRTVGKTVYWTGCPWIILGHP